ncbi:MAG: outer membrane protein assembly factor BamE [SAR86 cluster bacterium]|nr:outer membrane protein assembly factor BamE [SAR86 cluster bacterium]
MQYSLKLISIILMLSVISCSIPKTYKVVIRQGNIVEAEMVEKLEVGMTESQVRFVMGSPLIKDTFEPDIWIYQSRVSQGEKIIVESKITLYFEDGELKEWIDELPTSIKNIQ